MNFSVREFHLGRLIFFFRLCATYPKSVIVPRDISDDELRQACAARNNARFPAAVWCCAKNESVLLRSSQPCCGIFNYRFPLDEKLLECARKAVNGGKFYRYVPSVMCVIISPIIKMLKSVLLVCESSCRIVVSEIVNNGLPFIYRSSCKSSGERWWS